MKKILSFTILLCLALTMSIQLSAKVTAPLPSARGAGGEAFSGYLFAYFEGGGDANLMEQLRFAVSEDAVNWYALNGNKPIIGSDSISESGGIRDPHILRGEDGDYYIVATDMHTYDPKQGWGANPGIVMLKSKDLVNWTHSKVVLAKDFPQNFGDAFWVWAPQTIYDHKAKKYMIYFTLQRADRKTLITYYAYANRDFTAFEGEPKQLFSAKYGSIDNDIIYDNGTYHLFYKGNTKDENGKEYINGIQQATSKSLKGPWKEDFKYLDAYAGTNTHVEGSSVFWLNSEAVWILMYDLYSSGRYEFQTSSDLIHWTKEPHSFRKNFFPRHGSVISVTQEELDRVQQKWGYVLTHEFESMGNPVIRDKHTADPAVIVENDTLWLFAGHDMEGNQKGYVMKDWLLYSTTDMKHWTEHPSPLRIDDFKWADSKQAYAGHVVARDEIVNGKSVNRKYYWYVSTNWCGIGVAVSDKITGPYKDALGKPLLTNKDCFASKHSWACIDPAIFIDSLPPSPSDRGGAVRTQAYIIWGNKECYYAKLKDNMTEIDGDIHQIDVPNFTEAPWMHKYNGKYYLTYASEWPEKIAYAVADNIGGPYKPMGIISEIAGNSNTTHPAIVQFKGQWIFFSHNGGLPDGGSYSRSIIAEPMHYNADGSIRPIPPTKEGVTLPLTACHAAETDNGFVTVRDGHFVRGGEPYYYVGTNFWYGAILGSEGQGGNRARLCRELDAMKQAGIDNLRILVGSDGERGVTTKVEPTLQVSPGVYNDTLLAGLDYLLMEMGKRKMVAVLYLNNAWEWSGGYGYYLEKAGCGKAPRPNEAGYDAYMRFVSQYADNDSAHKLFYDYVRFIVGRTNRYTGVKYTDDPAIMSWQIGNEPRAFSTEKLPAFEHWISEAAALLRSLDKNHLISIGSEGAWGCEGDYGVWRRICADSNIDYCNVHLWPYNWGWARRDSLAADLPKSRENTKEYIDRHLSICAKIGKPLVMEEFGYPRDGMVFQPGSPTVCRDSYYRFIFQLIADSKQQGGSFAGCNFWGWGGEARPRHQQWQVGDDYCGDPAQEEQGLNSVFLADASTMTTVSDYAAFLSGNLTVRQRAIARLRYLQRRGIMFGHQDDPFYGLTWSGIEDPLRPERGRSDVLETCGDYPAVMGFDLGGIEMGDEKNLDSVPFTRIREELVAHAERGGIVTVSWHPRNPLTGGTAWDVNDTTVVRSILPGGSQHAKFLLWMKRVATFLHSLKTEGGVPVPVIFRPWHENCGSWFWWGERLCSPGEFRALWCMLQDYLTSEGFDNLVWSYSPNFDGHCTESKILERYPGDSRVDLIGLDCYQWGREEDFVRDINHDLAALSGFAAERGKLVALTECGLKNLSDPTWWTRVILPVVERHPLSYFHVWRNAKHEYFGPAPGEENAPYFNEMVSNEKVLMLKDITSGAW